MNLKSLEKPMYIGDSVYCGISPGGILVVGTCNKGNNLQNVIYLENEIIDRLMDYYAREVLK